LFGIIAFFCTCGLFTPDKPEYPEDLKDVDPLDFKQMILLGSSKNLKFRDYEELFHADFIYKDQSSNLEYTRKRLIKRLGDILSNYFSQDSNDTLKVVWTKTESGDDVLSESEGEYKLKERSYSIVTGQKGDSLLTDTIAKGHSVFYINVDYNKEMTVSYWEDSEENAQKRSFFHPDY